MALPALIFQFDTIRDDFATLGDVGPDPNGNEENSPSLIAVSEADLALLARLRNSDADALHEIFDTYLIPLVRFADVTLGIHDGAHGDAGDIVSDVLVTLWERREELHSISNLRAYLYRAVRNRALNHRRSQRRTEQRYASYGMDNLSDRTAHSDLPDAQLEYTEQQQIVWQTVQTMREPMRKVAILRWAHGLSFAEVAHIVDISESAARVYASRALKVLQKTLPELLR